MDHSITKDRPQVLDPDRRCGVVVDRTHRSSTLKVTAKIASNMMIMKID